MKLNQSLLFKIASNGLLFLFSGSLIFHILVLTGVINYSIIWGGRINNTSEMYIFESISLFTNALFLLIILLKAELLKTKLTLKVINIGVWSMAILFTLNTVGNLLSKNEMEKTIFTPVTLISAFLCVILAMKKSKE